MGCWRGTFGCTFVGGCRERVREVECRIGREVFCAGLWLL